MAAVVVIGASLAGMAAAARLAKARHRVTLLEQQDRVGGSWSALELDGVAVDAAPPIISFPAPWRDLFRKSGRTLEAEFARSGDELVPAGPTRHEFDTGDGFVLPVGRGDQHAAIGDRYGTAAADRWQQLVDDFGEVWQALRPLGAEAELTDRRQLPRSVRSVLRHRESLADLARAIAQPELGMIIADLGWRCGSDPARTPAFCAVQFYLERTFGRWTAGSGTTMIDSLRRRLELRRVDLRTGTRASMIEIADGRVSGVRTESGVLPADAVIACCDPEQLYRRLLPRAAAPTERRRLRRLPAAAVPAVSLDWLTDAAPDDGGDTSPAEAPDAPTETVRHRAGDGPRIEYVRTVPTPAGRRRLLTGLDYRSGRRTTGRQPAWDGFGSWLDRPPVTSSVTGLFSAGPHSRGGSGPSAELLSGALAAYGSARLIDPDRPLEPR